MIVRFLTSVDNTVAGMRQINPGINAQQQQQIKVHIVPIAV